MVLVGLVVAATITGFSLKSAHNDQRAAAAASQQAEAQQDQAAREKAAADAAATARAAVEAEKKRKAYEAKQAKAAADKAERKLRKASVHEIEASVKTMAKKHVKTGFIDGPIVRVSCDPVSGGSVDDLTEKTTVFQCFAANKTGKDGSAYGYYYNATMNWNTGSYTYGYGKP